MATKRHLQGVPAAGKAPEKPAAEPEKQATRSVSDAARNGTTRQLLEATRDRIAQAVENPNTPARDLAALTKRLMETVRDIEAIDARQKREDGSSANVQDGEFDAAAI